jgi:hypothetical protein
MYAYAEICKLGFAPSKMIIDSAPFLRYYQLSAFEEAEGLSRVCTSILLNKSIYHHYLITPVVKFSLLIYCTIMNLANSVILNEDSDRSNDLYLSDKTPNIPSLFIYSTGDKLIPPTEIQNYTNMLRKRDVVVEEKVFGDEVPHTGAFYFHTKEYCESINRFFCI